MLRSRHPRPRPRRQRRQRRRRPERQRRARQIQLAGLQPQGAVMVQLFNSEAGYRRRPSVGADGSRSAATPPRSLRRPRRPANTPSALFHDVNGDGEMNTNPFGIPTEPFAFSNNARGSFGPATLGATPCSRSTPARTRNRSRSAEHTEMTSPPRLPRRLRRRGRDARPRRPPSPAEAPWSLGLDNAPAEGFADAPMRLVHGRAPRGPRRLALSQRPGLVPLRATRPPATGSTATASSSASPSPTAARATAAAFADTPKRRIEMQRQEIVMPGFGTRGAPGAPVDNPGRHQRRQHVGDDRRRRVVGAVGRRLADAHRSRDAGDARRAPAARRSRGDAVPRAPEGRTERPHLEFRRLRHRARSSGA